MCGLEYTKPEAKDVAVASIEQGKRYAERWRTTRLYPEMRLRKAVAPFVEPPPRASRHRRQGAPYS